MQGKIVASGVIICMDSEMDQASGYYVLSAYRLGCPALHGTQTLCHGYMLQRAIANVDPSRVDANRDC